MRKKLELYIGPPKSTATRMAQQQYGRRGASTPLARAILQVTNEYEGRMQREKVSLSRRIDDLEEERDGLQSRVKSLRGEIAALSDAKTEALTEVDKLKAAALDAKNELKIERCRILGAMMIIADLEHHDEIKMESKLVGPDEEYISEESDEDDEEDAMVIVKKGGRRRGGKKKKSKKRPTLAAAIHETDDDCKVEEAQVPEPPQKASAMARSVAKKVGAAKAVEVVEACSGGQIKALEKLIQKSKEEDALYEAAEAVLSKGLDQASRGGHLRVCNLLIEHGARAERSTVEPADLEEDLLLCNSEVSESPALHAAIAKGFDDVAKLLIANGANANAVSIALGGSTPLHIAAKHNRSNLAHYLVAKCNARLDSVDDDGRTPADVAAEHRWRAVSKVLKDPSVLFWARANRANRLCKEGEMVSALKSFDLALAELQKMKAQGKGLNAANVMTLHNNRAKALMTLSRHLDARTALDLAFDENPDTDPTTHIAAFVKRCECDALLLDHAKAAAGYDRLIKKYETNIDDDDGVSKDKLEEWRITASRERTKLNVPPHELLGLSKTPTAADLKKAYRQMSIRWHPDRHASSTPEHKCRAHLQFQRISTAYETLLKQNTRTSDPWAFGEDDDDEGEESYDDEDDDHARQSFWRSHAKYS